jgi:hypothetical protein
MAQITGEILIHRRVEEVFDFVSNECNEPLYNVEMLSAEKTTGAPIGSGSRFHAVMRSGKREFPLDIEFTTFERPARLGSHSVAAGMVMDGELTFEPRGDSTLMKWEWNVRPTGALKLLSPLVTWMGVRQEKRIWGELKRYLES